MPILNPQLPPRSIRGQRISLFFGWAMRKQGETANEKLRGQQIMMKE